MDRKWKVGEFEDGDRIAKVVGGVVSDKECKVVAHKEVAGKKVVEVKYIRGTLLKGRTRNLPAGDTGYAPVGETLRRHEAQKRHEGRVAGAKGEKIAADPVVEEQDPAKDDDGLSTEPVKGSTAGGAASSKGKSAKAGSKRSAAKPSTSTPSAADQIRGSKLNVAGVRDHAASKGLSISVGSIRKRLFDVGADGLSREAAKTAAENDVPLLLVKAVSGDGKSKRFVTNKGCADVWIAATKRLKRSKQAAKQAPKTDVKRPAANTAARGNRNTSAPTISNRFVRDDRIPSSRRPGGRFYCYALVLLDNGGTASFEDLVKGCFKLRTKKFKIEDETEVGIKRDLTNQVHQWQEGNWGMTVTKDVSDCELDASGKPTRGESGKVKYTLKSFTE